MGDGSIVSSVSVTSPGASAMRMSIEVELPEGGELRFFDGQSSQGPDGSGYPVIGPIDLVPKNAAPGLLAPSAAEPEAAGAGLAQRNPTSHATRTSWAGNVGLRCANPTYGLPEHRCPSSHRSVKWPCAGQADGSAAGRFRYNASLHSGIGG